MTKRDEWKSVIREIILILAFLFSPFKKSDLLTHIKALDEKMKELTTKNESLERLIKEQEERIIEITTDSAHWERKSLSLSRELGKFSGSQMQRVSQYAELKEAYAVLKSKLQVRL